MNLAAENGQSEALKIIIKAGGDVIAHDQVYIQINCATMCVYDYVLYIYVFGLYTHIIHV